jgi:glutamate formiminotransferase
MRRIVECIPNFSEGRRTDVIDQIVAGIKSVPGAIMLDRESDPNHNRSVITFVASPENVVEAAIAGAKKAAELIDLNKHTGDHPRMGATDVIPFVPISGVTMEECIALARGCGERMWSELGIPVYLYEKAATRPERENLAAIRKGQFEAIRAEIATNEGRQPDFGGPRVHKPRNFRHRHRQQNRASSASSERRTALRKGVGLRAQGPWHRAGVDEHGEL